MRGSFKQRNVLGTAKAYVRDVACMLSRGAKQSSVDRTHGKGTLMVS